MNLRSFSPAATAFSDSVRALERVLDDSRSHWDDSARQAFDQRFAMAIQADGQKIATELQHLAQEMAAAARTLEILG
jgi:imidazolonepropionase-like amidohydrolase